MDSRTLGKALGVQPGTINAWVQRGYVPGMEVEVSGRRRDFDVGTATQIAIVSELMRFGLGGSPATHLAAEAIIAASRRGQPICLIPDPSFRYFFYFESEAKLSQALAKASPDQMSGVYVIIDVRRIMGKMDRIEKEWQRSRKGRGAKADG